MTNNVLKEELVLTTGQFDKNINNVIRKVEELKGKGKTVGDGFDSSMGKMIQKATGFNGSMGSLIDIVGKFGGALGVAMTAGDLFNRMMEQSQTIGDAVTKVQNQASEAVNYFASSMASADFGGFLDGLRNIISLAGDAADAMDRAASIATRFGWTNKAQVSAYNKAMAEARNPENTKEDRLKYLDEARTISQQIARNENLKSQADIDGAFKTIRTELAKVKYNGKSVDVNRLSDNDIRKLFDVANFAQNEKIHNDMKQALDGVVLTNTKYGAHGAHLAKRDQDKFSKNNRMLAAYAANEINDDADSELAKSLQMIGAADEMLANQAERDAQIGKLAQRINNNASKVTKGTTKPTKSGGNVTTHVAVYKAEAQTVQEIEDNITVLNKKLKDTKPNSEEYKKVSAEIKKWKDLLDTTPKPTFIENATVIKDINSNITILQERLDNTVRGSEEWLKISKQIKDESKKLSDIQDGSLADLQSQVSEIDDKLSKENLSLNTRLELIDKKAEIQKKIDNISDDSYIKVTPIVGDNRRKRNSISNAQTNINNIADDYDSGLIDYKSAKSQIDKINTDLINIGAKPIKVHLETDTEKFLSSLETSADSLLSSFNGIDGVIGDITSLSQAISEGANGWEVFMGVLQTGVGIIQTVSTVLNTLNTLQELFGTTSLVAAEQNAAAGASEMATAAGVTAAKSGEAIAGATASGAKMPFPYNLIAIAAGVAAVVAALATITGAFANGGVVGGSQYAGDALLARVNSGEMILNGSQQKNLFNLLDKGATGNVSSGNVNFVIRGKDLHGVLSNYDDKMKKVR